MTQFITSHSENKIDLMRKAASWRSFESRVEELCRPYDKIDNDVLDIGMDGDVYPGGHLYIFKHATYETLDIEEDLRPSYVGDIRDAWFMDNMFTVVLFIATLEHIIEGREKAIQEAYRITERGGLLVIVAPMVITENEKAYAEPVTLAQIKQALPKVKLHPEYFDDKKTLLVYIKKQTP